MGVETIGYSSEGRPLLLVKVIKENEKNVFGV